MQLFLYFANPKETILDSSHWCDNHLRPRFRKHFSRVQVSIGKMLK